VALELAQNRLVLDVEHLHHLGLAARSQQLAVAPETACIRNVLESGELLLHLQCVCIVHQHSSRAGSCNMEWCSLHEVYIGHRAILLFHYRCFKCPPVLAFCCFALRTSWKAFDLKFLVRSRLHLGLCGYECVLPKLLSIMFTSLHTSCSKEKMLLNYLLGMRSVSVTCPSKFAYDCGRKEVPYPSITPT